MSQPVFCQVRGVDRQEGDTHTVAGTRSDCGVPSTHLTGAAAISVRIRAYNATGELDIRRNPLTLGTRVLLTCDVIGLPEGSETLSYRWYRNCTDFTDISSNPRCEIQNGKPYYRIANDTILVDFTSPDQRGRYVCSLHGLNERGITPEVSVTG